MVSEFFFLAAVSLHCFVRAFSSCDQRGLLLVAVRRLLLLRSTGVVVVAHRLLAACRIFPDQGSNPCPLHWQVHSYPLDHHGSPVVSGFLEGQCPKV